jgi:peptidoglycan LD-endopeptidase CwlK
MHVMSGPRIKTWDAITDARLDTLYPYLAWLWAQVNQVLEAEGIFDRVDQALRTWSQQDADFEIGRDAAGNIVNREEVVTWARAGQSYHNYGLALDFVPMLNKIQPIWNRADATYTRTIQVAESFGLVSGSCWSKPKQDFPHLQLTGPFPENEPDDFCKSLWRGGGSAAVFAEMDKYYGIAA